MSSMKLQKAVFYILILIDTAIYFTDLSIFCKPFSSFHLCIGKNTNKNVKLLDFLGKNSYIISYRHCILAEIGGYKIVTNLNINL